MQDQGTDRETALGWVFAPVTATAVPSDRNADPLSSPAGDADSDDCNGRSSGLGLPRRSASTIYQTLQPEMTKNPTTLRDEFFAVNVRSRGPACHVLRSIVRQRSPVSSPNKGGRVGPVPMDFLSCAKQPRVTQIKRHLGNLPDIGVCHKNVILMVVNGGKMRTKGEQRRRK